MSLNPQLTAHKDSVSDLDFEKEIEFFALKGALVLEEIVLDCEDDRIILEAHRNQLYVLSREYFKDKPKSVPDKALKRVNLNNKKLKKSKKLLDREIFNRLLNEPSAITEQLRRNFELHKRENAGALGEKLAPQLLDGEGKPFKLQNIMCEFKTRRICFFKKGCLKSPCLKTHFILELKPYSKEFSGICSYDTRNEKCMENRCQYLHYRVETEDQIPFIRHQQILYASMAEYRDPDCRESQWINCDLRFLDYSILGKFDAIMLDPPWDIHMNLPYMTLKDKEMKSLKVGLLQNQGVCFLWVTGRALELGRECLRLWGYNRSDELVWVKTNQHGKLIRTGRTGHWLNHSKEHCLIGYKGDMKLINRNLDCDVLVSPVRETSRKPDEIYEIIERMVPNGRYCELFARPHNRRKRWLSLGNQLPGVYLVEQNVVNQLNQMYPDKKLTTELMEQFKQQEEKGNDEFIYAVYNNHLFKKR